MKLPPDIESGLACYALVDARWTTLGELDALSLREVDAALTALVALRRTRAP